MLLAKNSFFDERSFEIYTIMQTTNSEQVSQQKKVSGKNGEHNQTRGLLTLV